MGTPPVTGEARNTAGAVSVAFALMSRGGKKLVPTALVVVTATRLAVPPPSFIIL